MPLPTIAQPKPSHALFALSAAVSLLLAAPAYAAVQWPNSTASGVPITSYVGDQVPWAACSDGAGGFISILGIAPGTSIDLDAQRMDANGNPLWGLAGVHLVTSAGDQTDPRPVPDGSGGVIVVWQDGTSPGSIWAQRLNASGVAQWAASGVRVSTAALGQTLDDVVSDGAGGVIVSFTYAAGGANYDVYAQRLNGSGTRLWGAAGIAVAATGVAQQESRLARDAGQGVFVIWRDKRSGEFEIYGQHLNSVGSAQLTLNGVDWDTTVSGDAVNPDFESDGAGGGYFVFDHNAYGNSDVLVFPLSSSGYIGNGINVTASIVGDQNYAQLVPDGTGGVFVVWSDTRTNTLGDIYGTHLVAGGAYATGWSSTGNALLTGTGTERSLRTAIADGQGGLLLAWTEGYGSGFGYDVRALRIRGDATIAGGWTSNVGNPVFVKEGEQVLPQLVADGAGGAFCTAQSIVNGVATSLAQHIDRFGRVGDPAPHLAGVKDVKNDQGGFVRVSWSSSWLDGGVQPTVNGYQLWQQVPAFAAQAALRAGRARLEGDVAAAAAHAVLRRADAAAGSYYWEYAGGVPAQGFTGYSLTVPTPGDSMPGANAYTTYMVEAISNFSSAGPVAGALHWESPADSGYSVDNLAPLAPSGLSGSFTPRQGATLVWNANGEADLAGYRLHRGASPGFVPDGGNQVAFTAETWFVDAGALPAWYKLVAVDVHGNASAASTYVPASALAVEETLPVQLALRLASANPARGASTLAFDLPQRTHVAIEVFDAAGRSVRVLADEEFAAGRWSRLWDGRDHAGRSAPGGVYFVRLSAEGRTIVRRLVRLEG